MGVIRFLVHPPRRLTDQAIQAAYFTGMDRIPWPSRAYRTAEGLALERGVCDSGNLHLPWELAGQGLLTLATGSLMEREGSYHLQVELARGKVNQVRCQLAEWQVIGLAPPRALLEAVHKAVELFALAATAQDDVSAAAGRAEEAIEAAARAASLLAGTFSEQALAARLRHAPRVPMLLGANLGAWRVDPAGARLLEPAFNAAVVPLAWPEIEPNQGMPDWSLADAQLAWAKGAGLKALGGPLVRLDNRGIPDWLYLWEGDFDSVLSFLSEHIERTVVRYRGQVPLWICASRVNTGTLPGLGEIDKQRLAVRAVELVRRLDAATPAILLFDQPWAEYMRQQESDPPLYFADLIARAGVGLSGVGLEVNLGYYPGGTYPRDLLDFSHLIDRWSLLGLPLYVFLTVPSSNEPDPRAWSPAGPMPAFGGPSEESQKQWTARLVQLLMAKPAVHGVIWNHLLDAEPHEFAHSGLFHSAGKAKRLLGALAGLRRAHLE